MQRNGMPYRAIILALFVLGTVYLMYLYNTTLGRLRDAESSAERYRREEETKVAQLQDVMKNKDELQERCDNEKRELTNRLNSLNQNHKMLKDQNDEHEVEQMRLEQEVRRLKEEFQQVESQRNQEYQQLKQEKELELSTVKGMELRKVLQLAAVKDQLADLQRENQQLESQISALRTEVQNGQQQLAGKQAQLLQQQQHHNQRDAALQNAAINFVQPHQQQQQQPGNQAQELGFDGYVDQNQLLQQQQQQQQQQFLQQQGGNQQGAAVANMNVEQNALDSNLGMQGGQDNGMAAAQPGNSSTTLSSTTITAPPILSLNRSRLAGDSSTAVPAQLAADRNRSEPQALYSPGSSPRPLGPEDARRLSVTATPVESSASVAGNGLMMADPKLHAGEVAGGESRDGESRGPENKSERREDPTPGGVNDLHLQGQQQDAAIQEDNALHQMAAPVNDDHNQQGVADAPVNVNIDGHVEEKKDEARQVLLPPDFHGENNGADSKGFGNPDDNVKGDKFDAVDQDKGDNPLDTHQVQGPNFDEGVHDADLKENFQQEPPINRNFGGQDALEDDGDDADADDFDNNDEKDEVNNNNVQINDKEDDY